MGRPKGHKTEVFVKFFPNNADDFSHGESRQYRSDTKSFDASDTDESD